MYITSLPYDVIIIINEYLLHTCGNCNKRVYENEFENIEFYKSFMPGYWYINNKIIKNKCVYC
jgi:hypothetical protein